MVEVIVVLIVMVCGIQWLGDRIVAKVDKRH
jgi:D-methionine transport system permease protein